MLLWSGETMANRTSNFGVALYGPDKGIADDFAGADAPKLKFYFTISFDFVEDMILASEDEKGSENLQDIKFGVRQITRPNPNIIYEDINYYNFMTKVATKVDFGVVTVTLYDDRKNRAHNIFKKYMEAVSPVTTNRKEKYFLLQKLGQSDASSIGPLTTSARNSPIKNIRVTHLVNGTDQKVFYDYLNPKIQNVMLDELDMTQSDVNTITFTFIYDSFNISSNFGVQTKKKAVVPGNATVISGATSPVKRGRTI